MGKISSNGIINLMRGDSFTTPIIVNLGTKLHPNIYKLKTTDRLYFGLMEPNQAFEDAVLKKVIDSTTPTDDEGNPLLMLKPQDTENLLVGIYYYMIKLRIIDTFNQECVITIVNPTVFNLNGHNPKPDEDDMYYEKDEYDVDRVIFEGGEII